MFFTLREMIKLNEQRGIDYLDIKENYDKYIDLDIINKEYINKIYLVNSPYHELDNIKQYIESISSKLLKLLIQKNTNKKNIEQFLDKISGLNLFCITLIKYNISIYNIYSYIINFISSIIFKDIYFNVFVYTSDGGEKYNNKIMVLIEPINTDSSKRLTDNEAKYFIDVLNGIFNFYFDEDGKILIVDTLVIKSKYWIDDNNMVPKFVGNEKTVKDFYNSSPDDNKLYILNRYQYLEKLNILMDDIKFDKDKIVENVKNDVDVVDEIENTQQSDDNDKTETENDLLDRNINIIKDYLLSLCNILNINNKLSDLDITSTDDNDKRYPLLASVDKLFANPNMTIAGFVDEMIKLLNYINFKIKPKIGYMPKIENYDDGDIEKRDDKENIEIELSLKEIVIPKNKYIKFFDDLLNNEERNELYKFKDYIIDMIQYTNLSDKNFISSILKNKKIFTCKSHKIFTKNDGCDIILLYDKYSLKLKYNNKNNSFESIHYKNKMEVQNAE